jgi:hypothetical protein
VFRVSALQVIRSEKRTVFAANLIEVRVHGGTFIRAREHNIHHEARDVELHLVFADCFYDYLNFHAGFSN